MAVSRKWALSLFLLVTTANAQNILNNTGHFSSGPGSMLSVLGISGPVVSQTCPQGGNAQQCIDPYALVPAATFIADATDANAVLFPAGDQTAISTPNPNVPYKVLTQSYFGYSFAGSLTHYTDLAAADVVYNYAFCNGGGLATDMPPVTYTTVLMGSLSYEGTCTPGPGVELSMSQPYKGFSVTSVSEATALMAGVLSAMRHQHSTWTWPDIKGALRQTACNWSGGFQVIATNCGGTGNPGFGFGNIDYDAAVALSSTAAVYLQSPIYTIINSNYSLLTITLYPYLQTRRAKEVFYVGGTWPAASSVNEMTAAQVAAAGGTKIFDDGGATGIQTFTYRPPLSGTYVVVGLTLDASGNASRVESYMPISQIMIVGQACAP